MIILHGLNGRVENEDARIGRLGSFRPDIKQ
jgi:hypothetical protein